jgi:hypothetical protein
MAAPLTYVSRHLRSLREARLGSNIFVAKMANSAAAGSASTVLMARSRLDVGVEALLGLT